MSIHSKDISFFEDAKNKVARTPRIVVTDVDSRACVWDFLCLNFVLLLAPASLGKPGAKFAQRMRGYFSPVREVSGEVDVISKSKICMSVNRNKQTSKQTNKNKTIV